MIVEKTDQLLAKALSTSSEDEAIACLKMARKYNGSFLPEPNQKITTNDSNEWCTLANFWRAEYHKVITENKTLILEKRKTKLQLDKAKSRIGVLSIYILGVLITGSLVFHTYLFVYIFIGWIIFKKLFLK